jgi:peptidoglycan biosynthesis protein MviN/MurJ (putative lipid II flippase)
MLLLRQGTFMVRVAAIALVLSVATSLSAALGLGLAGAAAGSVAAIYLEHVATLRRISRCTAIPVRRLQDWRTLGLLLACATIAGAVAWAGVDRFFGGGELTRAAAGALLLASAYAALVLASGAGRHWLDAALRPERGD